ncbi:Glycosyltransferase, catalytic subunit of cellulose synthase and poly-beta-1,6-N-acetylglucosamine synthase [Mucilaginibacter pineti]|uniref:Glycosyltransferase, catalytic subunit of cellulose synthase and poly-beta-1,6-N-acetylglucosamine synthase n=1 Tax=Mucilaginibacter pineti TaxID=1391627 RepID=A0A1G7FL46_9SPHI|nr:glycosyltransferase [Mucilaginibacter pineti]SDE76622.1 Glycosyltransferase, catalytic subunit of cellulose synthase and poly-beta-1,6-N-acetylglucosamine synthase [Mucilaginibacter pineti]
MIALLSIFTLFLTVVYVLLLLFLIKGWANVKEITTTGKTSFTTKVTILIAARNEAESIHLTIGDILAQDYPTHLREIIIVDDHSTDNTAEIIRSYANQGVKLLQLNESQALNSYKKKAIGRAINLSTGDLMVATDADCRMGTAWLSSIVANYEIHNPVMISSPVTYFEEASLFELMQTLEFAFLIGIGGAFIGNKRASTCNGANFAYRKDVFYEVGGFTGIDDLASGDDELLLQKVAERYPGRINFLKQSEAVVYTHAKPNLSEFMQQRRRWASKSTKYKDKRVVALGLTFWLFNFMLLVNALLGFYDFYFFKLFLVQFLLKYLFEIFYGLPILKFFKRSYLISLIFIVAPLHVIYIVVIGFIGNNKKYSWKGRVVK